MFILLHNMAALDQLETNPNLITGYALYEDLSSPNSQIWHNSRSFTCYKNESGPVARLDKLVVNNFEQWFLYVKRQIEDRGYEKIYSVKEIPLDGSLEQLKQELDKL